MAQRLRICFARRDGVKYLSHLELMRTWERVLRRAGWRLAYSQGFNPHPRISFAAALPVGVAGEAELLEVHLDGELRVEDAGRALAAQLPAGMEVRAVEEIPLEAPAIQRRLVAAEYVAVCPKAVSEGDLRLGVEWLLVADSLMRERKKEDKVQLYDLRPMSRWLEVTRSAGGSPSVRMELRTDAQGAGRPDEVLREMGLDPADCEVTRTRLLLSD